MTPKVYDSVPLESIFVRKCKLDANDVQKFEWRRTWQWFGELFVDPTSEYQLRSSSVPLFVLPFCWTDSSIYFSADADDDARESFNVLE